jgi:hypothetical protein
MVFIVYKKGELNQFMITAVTSTSIEEVREQLVRSIIFNLLKTF